MSDQKINLAIIGPGFGAEFIPICRRPPNARQSANIACAGILAHESALKGGEIVKLPEFTF